mgnify:FL=1
MKDALGFEIVDSPAAATKKLDPLGFEIVETPELSGSDVASRLKNDPDFSPTPEEIARGYRARMSLPDPSAVWEGAKHLVTKTLPAQLAKAHTQLKEASQKHRDLQQDALLSAVATLGETARHA